jgi:hypothetical protein
MLWLAEYFEKIWGWEAGVNFVYLAPLNSMASRINGFTVHSWGEIAWCMESPTGPMTLCSGRSDSRDMSSMAAKLEHLKWLFIDESEAVGAGHLGTLEENVSQAAPKRWCKCRGGVVRPENLRLFGGVNLALFGDSLQLPPVQQVSIMANPFRERATASHHARKMQTCSWQHDPLNGCSQKCLYEFAVCKRIDDEWYIGVVDECRQ